MPAIVKLTVLSTRSLVSGVRSMCLQDRISSSSEEFPLRKLKFKKTPYQIAGEKAVKSWEERLGAKLVPPREPSPLFTPPTSPRVALPPPLKESTNVDMVSLGSPSTETDYGDNVYMYVNSSFSQIKSNKVSQSEL